MTLREVCFPAVNGSPQEQDLASSNTVQLSAPSAWKPVRSDREALLLLRASVSSILRRLS